MTPFTTTDEVDVSALTRLVEAQIGGGIEGLVACGTTGESPTLSADEHERVVRSVLEASGGRVPVVAGTGGNSTRAVAEATARAARWGIDAALIVCPYYNRPTQEGLFRHFQAVHEAAGVPLIAYNVPGRTASDLLPDTIARLVDAGVIAAVKDATGNLQRATETLNAVAALGEGAQTFSLLSGDDFTTLPFVASGGSGVISVVSNLCPGDVARLVRLAEQGDRAAAIPLHGRLVELSRVLFSTSSPIPVKAGLALAGWCTAALRLPLDPEPPPAVFERVRAALAAYRVAGGQHPGPDLAGFMS